MRRIIPFLLLVLAGCWNPFCPPTEPPVGRLGALEPISPERVLNNLVIAYLTTDMDLYLSCLADSFRFHFDIRDQGLEDMLRDLGIKEDWWGRTEERLATEAMFGSFNEKNLVVTPVFTVVRTDTISETVHFLQTRYTFDPPVIEQFTIEGTANFTIQRNPQGHWEIYEWWDRISP